jgi:hypothetical protein
MRLHKISCLIRLFLFLFLVLAFHRLFIQSGISFHADALQSVDTLLDQALRLSLVLSDAPIPLHNNNTGFSSFASQQPTSPASVSIPDIPNGSTTQLLCQILRGKTMLLVGPRETLYQLHSFLLTALKPGLTSSSTAPALDCPGGPSSCPHHPLCHPLSRPSNFGPLTPTDVIETNTSLMRFIHSTNLNPSPAPRGDPWLTLPSLDPRTGVRIVDSRWVRYASSSKINILVLNRAPLSAPAWSYYYSNASAPATSDWSWLTTLGHLEKQHAQTLSEPFFAHVLSRLDHHHRLGPPLAARSGSRPTHARRRLLLLNAALHSTVSTFLPSLLLTLTQLREHAGHRAILGKKPVLWYGSWYLPVSCAPESIAVFSSENDPRRLLVRLLAEAEARDNPWSAYYNAQGWFGKLGRLDLPVRSTKFRLIPSVYMHDRLLARLLPAYGIDYISSLSTAIPPEVEQKDAQGDRLLYVPRFRS